MMFAAGNGKCQDDITSGLVPALFRSDSPIPITIRTDLITLIRQMTQGENYQPADIIYSENGITDTLETRIRIRGHFRKDTANCDFPPLRINFRKSVIRNTIFGPQDEFRIVTHCRTYDEHFIQYIYREYLVYKMYQTLNPLSLNVRLARITYVDSEGRISPFTRYAFILEDEDEFATRFNMEEVEGHVSYNDIEHDNALMLSLFQFMIGNTDWIIQFSKNLIILKKGDTYYAVPYDFDYCGIVNTDYRNIHGYTSLTEPERLFRGKCYTRAELKAGIRQFRKSKRHIMRLLLHSKQLDHDSFVYMYNYISRYYGIIRSRKERQKYLYVNCGSR